MKLFSLDKDFTYLKWNKASLNLNRIRKNYSVGLTSLRIIVPIIFICSGQCVYHL